MLNLDPGKLLVVLVLALIVIGPERLPRFAKQFARAWKTLTSYREQAEEEIRKAIPNLDLPRVPTNPSIMVSGFLSDLMTPTSNSSAALPPSEREEERDAAEAHRSGDVVAAPDSRDLAMNSTFSSANSIEGDLGRNDPNMN